MAKECQDHDEYAVKACSAFPFTHFACRLPPNPEPKSLYEAYLSLYSAAIEAIPSFNSDHFSVTNGAQDQSEVSISYNLGMLTDVMALCPRKSESGELNGGHGEVWFNGTVIAGTCMLKDEAVWKKIKEEPEMMEGVFDGIGYPFPSANSKREAEMIDEKL